MALTFLLTCSRAGARVMLRLASADLPAPRGARRAATRRMQPLSSPRDPRWSSLLSAARISTRSLCMRHCSSECVQPFLSLSGLLHNCAHQHNLTSPCQIFCCCYPVISKVLSTLNLITMHLCFEVSTIELACFKL